MKLIINISDEIYNKIVTKFRTFPKEMKDWGLRAIRYGVPYTDWIPVTKQLPDEDEEVLVTREYKDPDKEHAYRYVEIASRFGNRWHSYSDEYKSDVGKYEVVAWKPLPEKYKGE